jgi:hypothetical protein
VSVPQLMFKVKSYRANSVRRTATSPSA